MNWVFKYAFSHLWKFNLKSIKPSKQILLFRYLLQFTVHCVPLKKFSFQNQPQEEPSLYFDTSLNHLLSLTHTPPCPLLKKSSSFVSYGAHLMSSSQAGMKRTTGMLCPAGVRKGCWEAPHTRCPLSSKGRESGSTVSRSPATWS